MNPLIAFTGNGLAGSIALRIYETFIEHEHRNYVVAIPIDKIGSVTFSKSQDSTHNSVSIDDITFGCDNKHEVYTAILQVLQRSRGITA